MIAVIRGRGWLAALAAVLAAAALFAMPAPGADAHPLGNFTVNRYSRIETYSDVVRVYYVLDMAEIPTFQEMPSIDANGDGETSPAEADGYAGAAAAAIASNIKLEYGGEPVELQPLVRSVEFPEGQAGLDTLRLSLVFEGPPPEGAVEVAYEDRNYADRLGWREVVVKAAAGALLTGDAPIVDISAALTAYPENQLSSPLSVSSVAFGLNVSAAGQAPPLSESSIATAPAAASGGGFAGLIDADNLTVPVILLGLLAAFGFGAVHALEPGHGKTLVAAYFVGVHGTARQALALGAIIATTHSLGVLAIGGVTIFASQWILPERVYPWLTLASGVMVLLLGLRLIAARGGLSWLSRAAHRLFPHHHHHHEQAAIEAGGAPPWRSLITLGLIDGLTPSPSALVVLLAAVSLDRVGLGIALIVAFSVGLAAILGAVCLALIYARRVTDWLSNRLAPSRGARLAALVTPDGAVMRLLPVGGACALVVVGLVVTMRGLSSAGLGLL